MNHVSHGTEANDEEMADADFFGGIGHLDCLAGQDQIRQNQVQQDQVQGKIKANINIKVKGSRQEALHIGPHFRPFGDRRERMISLLEWSLGSPTISTRPPHSMTVSRSGTESAV